MSSGKINFFLVPSSANDHLSSNEERAHNSRLEREAEKARKEANSASFEKRPFAERKAALNLTQMALTTDVKISPDAVLNLIGTLIVSHPELGKLQCRQLIILATGGGAGERWATCGC